MATITMPQLGETVTEGTVAQWLKTVGDAIEKYEAFVEISTDKVNAEVPSPVTGVLREIIVAAGETVAIGAPIAIIEEVTAVALVAPASEPPHGNGDGAVVPASYGAAGGMTNGNGAHRNGHGGASVHVDTVRRMSPAVRRLAREHKVDVAALRGTGSSGRVTALDVLAATTLPAPVGVADVGEAAAVSKPAAERAAGSLGRSSYAAPLPGTLVPLSPARKLIAQRMTESLANAPHAWTMVEVDVTKLVARRNREKERFMREQGYALTLLPFFIGAVVGSLRAHPLLNSRFTSDGIVIERDVNIGIAIGLETNLVVPVIRQADSLSISGLAVALGKLIERARAGKLGADELGGGTFTVNNTGANGSVLSQPIINGGQAAIVTMEAIVKRPVVIDDAIAIRSMMNVCLSLDHRVIDGAGANGFLSDLKARLQTADENARL
jgi:2-oxoisovalerate dehydrogenase E2 component (dihydrolipoyl transacylase)